MEQLRNVAPGNAQTFFTDGITASMTEAGVSAPDIATYLAANGTLVGTNAQKLQQIIEEKYIALFGVSGEPWTDWRRTGYPTMSAPTNAIINNVPRTLFYPQSEIDLKGFSHVSATPVVNMDFKPHFSNLVFWFTGNQSNHSNKLI